MSVRNALLGLLEQKPRHGYELRAAFTTLVGGDQHWEVKPAQIYTTLERLAASGLICRESNLGEGDQPARRIYAITPAGREALAAWFAVSVEPGHFHDEFYLKLITALACGMDDIRGMIQNQRARLYQEKRYASRQRDRYDPASEMAQILLVDKVMQHLDADLHWLDIAEVRLSALRSQPAPEPRMRRRGRPHKQV